MHMNWNYVSHTWQKYVTKTRHRIINLLITRQDFSSTIYDDVYVSHWEQ